MQKNIKISVIQCCAPTNKKVKITGSPDQGKIKGHYHHYGVIREDLITVRTRLCIFTPSVKSVLHSVNSCLSQTFKICWKDKVSNDHLWKLAGEEGSGEDSPGTSRGKIKLPHLRNIWGIAERDSMSGLKLV